MFEDIFSIASRMPKGMKPKKHRGKPVSRKFKNLQYRRTHYVWDKRGRRICWMWTTTRNTDGLFVGCREVYCSEAGVGFRDEYRARKTRWRVKEWAMTQFNKSPHRTGSKYSNLPSQLKARRKAYRQRVEAGLVEPKPTRL